ncbi:MAG: CDGSH iron-sulfur domain-containing protein [Spirochaetia bacterium]|nr:CDGSH iron-sulfur domain-containing protein [Spirochaetia bacterium]
MKNAKITVCKDGPYIVSGGLPLDKVIAQTGDSGEPEKWVKGEEYEVKDRYSLCRCGKSKNMPFCDDSHTQAGFKGTETAGYMLFEDMAETYEGPGVDLKDAVSLCASARFCHPKGGTWDLVENSDDPDSKKTAIEQACNCPPGRLVVYDKETGKPIEPDFKPSISLIEDPQAGCSGPIWVKGGVEIVSAEGIAYEKRNRVTLCRCGKSKNKPFCDSRHISARFNDGDGSIHG